jgi:hypothetical protein
VTRLPGVIDLHGVPSDPGSAGGPDPSPDDLARSAVTVAPEQRPNFPSTFLHRL